MTGGSQGISYAILSQPRTGSTLLSELLRDRGLGDPDEYLNTDRIARIWPALGGSDQGFDVDRYVRLLRNAQSASSEHFGIKIHYSHLITHFKDRASIRKFISGFDRIIVLTRANKLAQAVSALKADQTGRWRASAPTSNVEPTFDPVFIADGIRRFLFQESQIAGLKIADTRPAFFVTYETLSNSTAATWEAVQKFLGVTPQPVPAAIQSRPQRDALSHEFEDRFLKLIRGEPVGS